MRLATALAAGALLLAAGAAAKNIIDPSNFVIKGGKLSGRQVAQPAGTTEGVVRAGHGDHRPVRRPWDQLRNQANQQEQPIVLPPGSNDNGEGALEGDEAPQSGPTLLRTQLAVMPSVSIFASYVRDIPEFELALDDSSAFTIVLAPANEAFSRLGRKPWEFPEPVNAAKSEEEEDAIIRGNIRSFVMHHVFSSANERETAQMLLSKDMVVKSTKHGMELLLEHRPVEVVDFVRVKNGIILVISEALVSA